MYPLRMHLPAAVIRFNEAAHLQHGTKTNDNEFGEEEETEKNAMKMIGLAGRVSMKITIIRLCLFYLRPKQKRRHNKR